tara:strand:+ start:372 stop:512 length:141 start_codon:yes stop_codon:yes gene_type:complete
MQNEKEISKIAHKILRKRMAVTGVKTFPIGWASQAMKEAKNQLVKS